MSEVATQAIEEVQTEEGPSSFSEEANVAAREFGILTPQIKARIKTMASKNGKGLARVVIAATEFPYATSYPNFKNEAEQTLFMMLLQLNGVKDTLNQAMKPHLGEIQEEVAARAVDTMINKTAAELPATENTEESANG